MGHVGQSESKESKPRGEFVGVMDEYGTIWSGEPGTSKVIGDAVVRPRSEETMAIFLAKADAVGELACEGGCGRVWRSEAAVPDWTPTAARCEACWIRDYGAPAVGFTGFDEQGFHVTTKPRSASALSRVQDRLSRLLGEAMSNQDEEPRVFVIDRYGGRSVVADIRLDWEPQTLEEAEDGTRHPVVYLLPPAEQ